MRRQFAYSYFCGLERISATEWAVTSDGRRSYVSLHKTMTVKSVPLCWPWRQPGWKIWTRTAVTFACACLYVAVFNMRWKTFSTDKFQHSSQTIIMLKVQQPLRIVSCPAYRWKYLTVPYVKYVVCAPPYALNIPFRGISVKFIHWTLHSKKTFTPTHPHASSGAAHTRDATSIFAQHRHCSFVSSMWPGAL